MEDYSKINKLALKAVPYSALVIDDDSANGSVWFAIGLEEGFI